MLKNNLLIILLILLINTLKAQDKIKYDGFFELGFKAEYNDIYVRSFYKTKLEYNIHLNDKIKVQIDTRANSENRTVELYEASSSIFINDHFQLDIGEIKKRFGIEEWVSREKLLTIRRSMLNRFFEPLGYVNREPGIRINYCNKNKKLFTGMHYNESHNLTFITGGYINNILGLSKIFITLQFINRKDEPLPNSYALNSGFNYSIKHFFIEFEYFFGLDPIETYYSSISEQNENTYFTGIRNLFSSKFYLNNSFITYFEPIFSSSLLINNLKNIEVNKIEILLGLNFYFEENLRLMFNGDLILSNDIYYKNKRSLTNSNIIIQLQIKW